MRLVHRLLDRVKRRPGCRKPLDRGHLVTFGLHREHQARPHRRSVEENGAAAAHAMLAAHMGAGESEIVAQMIGEQAARIIRGRMDCAVDPHAPKSLSVTTWTRGSRNSAVASTPPLGSTP